MPMYEVIFAKRLADVGTVVELDEDEAKNLVRWGRLKPVEGVVDRPRRRRRVLPADQVPATAVTSDDSNPGGDTADESA